MSIHNLPSDIRKAAAGIPYGPHCRVWHCLLPVSLPEHGLTEQNLDYDPLERQVTFRSRLFLVEGQKVLGWFLEDTNTLVRMDVL